MILRIEEIFKLSFPDARVIKSSMNVQNKIFVMDIDNAWLDEDSGKVLNNVRLHISKWKELIVKKYESESETWINEDNHTNAFLKDICEFEFSLEKLVIKGFSFVNNQWHEWSFINSNVSINCTET